MKTFTLCVAALVAAVTLTSVAAARPESRHATDSAQASSKIAFTRGSPTDGIYVMNADGSGKRLLMRNAGPLYAWSPDGRKVAFGRGLDGNEDIFVMSADGSGQRNLTRTRTRMTLNEGAVWSPDGRKIAFTRLSGSAPAPEIYVMNADGSRQRRLTRSTTADIFPAWSPDGRKIAFDGGGPIHVMNADGSGKRLLTRNGEHGAGGAAWSPDGRRIAFTGGDRNGWDVYVINADGSGQRNLTRRPVDYGVVRTQGPVRPGRPAGGRSPSTGGAGSSS